MDLQVEGQCSPSTLINSSVTGPTRNSICCLESDLCGCMPICGAHPPDRKLESRLLLALSDGCGIAVHSAQLFKCSKTVK